MRVFLMQLSCLLLFCTALQTADAQLDEGQVRQKMSAQLYTVRVQTAIPLRGRSIPITSPYDLRVTPDSVIADLPYFGRAFSAPYGSTDNGIKFISTNFSYTSKFRKNRWEILIQPKDATDIDRVTISIFNNGRSTVRVQSNNRQSISFDVYLLE